MDQSIADYHYNRFVRGKFNPLVSEIKPMTIQKFYNSLDVTYSTMSAIHKFMRGFFKWAEQNSYCPDFSRSVLLPDKPRNKKSNYIITWSDEEIKTMFDAIEKCNLRFIVVLALYTGMRMGEVQGLKFSDFRDDYILTERQYQNGSFVPTSVSLDEKKHAMDMLPDYGKKC